MNHRYIFLVGTLIFILTLLVVIEPQKILADVDGSLFERQNEYSGRTKSNKKVAEESKNMIVDVLKKLNRPGSYATPTPNGPGNSLTPSASPNLTGTPFDGAMVSYYQCDYRDVPLRDGCNACKAGCGPTSVAQILSTLIDRNEFTPPKVIGLYTANGLPTGCGGSSITSAKSLLDCFNPSSGKSCKFTRNGPPVFFYEEFKQLQTTGYIINYDPGYRIDDVADDMRPYLKSGWVLLVGANFCSGGCGHFIVVTDIDENNMVTAYDPYYEPGTSRVQPVHYQNRKPYPLYRYIVGVKIKS